MSELSKTSLLVIASIFTSVGGALLAGEDKVWGAILLLGAVGVLILRGFLKKKGVDIESSLKK